MKKHGILKIIAVMVCLFACSACAPNATDFIQMSGYDAQDARTGSVLPTPSTLTPY